MARARAEWSAIGIDVDSLRFYREIHGLDRADPRRSGADPIYTVAMARFFDLIAEAGVPATVFLIAEDAPAYPRELLPLAATRSEVASHSYAHDYRLTQRTRGEIAEDLLRAHAALLPLAPSGTLQGFRAPGYNTSPALLETVAALGYTYDSSLLPSPLYYAARAAAIGAYAALGRPSRSIPGDVRAFFGPFGPYALAPDRPWRAAEDGGGRRRALIEIPIACEPLTRAPLIGTTWAMAGDLARRLMLRVALGRLPLFNFEMHAVDLLDATDPGVPAELARAQRDLAVPAAEKMRAFRSLFHVLAGETEVLTLGAIAGRVASSLP